MSRDVVFVSQQLFAGMDKITHDWHEYSMHLAADIVGKYALSNTFEELLGSGELASFSIFLLLLFLLT